MALAGTYECSILCLIWRRLAGKPLPPAPWSLGWLGLPINCLGVLYGLYILAYAVMPSTYPVTAADFNYAPVMFGGVILLPLVYYVIWGKRYRGPVVHVAKD